MGQTVDLQFRQAEPRDAAEILAVKRTAIESTDGTYDETQVEAWRPSEEALPAFEHAMESEQFVVLLAETDSEAAGYGVLNVEEGRIDAVFVDPEYAGLGVGTSLVGQLETRARMLGRKELTIVSSLNARAFYESLGYEMVGARTRTIDGVDLEFVTVRKEL